jgi:hypothetical protein
MAVQITRHRLLSPQQYVHLCRLIWDLPSGPAWTIPKTPTPSPSLMMNQSSNRNSHHHLLRLALLIPIIILSRHPHYAFATRPQCLPHLQLPVMRCRMACAHMPARDHSLDLREVCILSLALWNRPMRRWLMPVHPPLGAPSLTSANIKIVKWI